MGSTKLHMNCRVTHQVGDYILLALIWSFQCLPYSAWAAANLAELACHVAKKVELPKQGQQNIVADLMGHPVHLSYSGHNIDAAESPPAPHHRPGHRLDGRGAVAAALHRPARDRKQPADHRALLLRHCLQRERSRVSRRAGLQARVRVHRQREALHLVLSIMRYWFKKYQVGRPLVPKVL